MKKNQFFILGVLAVALAFIVTMAACTGKKDSSGDADAAQATEETDANADIASASSNVQWSDALDTYEKFVDDYVAFMKKYKENPSDTTLLTEYASMAEQAQKATDAINAVQAGLSEADLTEFTARYGKIAEKMTAALQ
jgi:hypothetical protein